MRPLLWSLPHSHLVQGLESVSSPLTEVQYFLPLQAFPGPQVPAAHLLAADLVTLCNYLAFLCLLNLVGT